MSLSSHLHHHATIGRSMLKWIALAVPVGIITGSACALFLWLLDVVTVLRFQNPWLLYLLPIAGAAIGWMYHRWGRSVEAGNNLIIDEIHEPGGGVPWRMAPLVLIGTIITHLFGGSAGREGTAVQMGGSFASGLTRLIPGLSEQDVRCLLMAGIAAGFGGVFGTPVAGMIFAMEVLVVGRMHSIASLPCLVASIVSDQTCTAWGIQHTPYFIASVLPKGSSLHLAPLVPWTVFCTVLAGLAFGLLSLIFAELTHGLGRLFKSWIRWPILRPVIGGTIVIALVQLLGTRDYLGLGVTSPDEHAVTIVSAFQPGGAHSFSWFWKILFTAITLGSGFKGGEVTPLFFIGATAGNILAVHLGVPVDLFAALGFVAVFAGATNTPIACTVMAVELFGSEHLLYFMIACLTAYLASGQSGIYSSQRVETLNSGHVQPGGLQKLHEVRKKSEG
ncbi:voltage-gated chloride channel family protein [Planctomicrobium sp. SH661]|uniref:voltage-gated chloride channel family protein n=1 Tax=Planctomicrobium sp. SH661 TaxID=3448124 RepID=UPI003F5B6C40